ncbi:MAG: ArsR/SmtB family transcription factor [Christensenellales bacterium]|jgi:DNA-binding transcriptional ArsR family regulator
MEIAYRPAPGMVFDLIQGIKYGVNDELYDRIVALAGIAPDPAVSEAAQSIWQSQDRETPGAVLFFSKKNCPECFMTHYYFRRLGEFPSPEALIENFRSMDHVDLRREVFSFYVREARRPDCSQLFADPATLHAMIDAVPGSPVLKWEMMTLIYAPGKLIEPTAALMTAVAGRLAEVYRKNAKTLENFRLRIETKISNDLQVLREELSQIESRFAMTFGDRLTFSCSFMHETTIAPIRQRDSQIVILGVNYQKILGTHYVDNDPINLDATLKALSDTARLKILQMLALRDMYVAEIAEAIDKGMSTTSYHLDMLHFAGLVSSRTEGKRTYYMLDRANFQKRLELLQHFMGMKR